MAYPNGLSPSRLGLSTLTTVPTSRPIRFPFPNGYRNRKSDHGHIGRSILWCLGELAIKSFRGYEDVVDRTTHYLTRAEQTSHLLHVLMNTTIWTLSKVLAKVYKLPTEDAGSSASLPCYIVEQHAIADLPTFPRRFECSLCNVFGLKLDAIKYHFDHPEHKENLERLEQDLTQIAEVSIRYCQLVSNPFLKHISIADQIGDLPSRDAVQAELYRFLVAKRDGASSGKRCGRNELYSALEPVLKKLKRLERNERLFLLTLAIWKSQCLMNMPNCKRERDMGNYLAAQEWARSGWKKRKHEVRTSNAIGIIVSAVRPFLEKGPTATGELDGTPS